MIEELDDLARSAAQTAMRKLVSSMEFYRDSLKLNAVRG
jgi:hypothetical protein